MARCTTGAISVYWGKAGKCVVCGGLAGRVEGRGDDAVEALLACWKEREK